MMNAVDSPVPEAVDADDLNISDVIEVIERDAGRGYDESMMGDYGGVSDSSSVYSTVSSVPPPSYDPLYEQKKLARCEIIEQPASRALRFRYECEGRSAGSIPGARSTADNKTFPTIRVVGYTGPAVVVVSCITKDPPYRAHPHKLVGKEGCKKGVCTIQIDPKQMQVSFSNLGIQCVKKKDVVDSLRERESIRVDPFKSGFAHRNQPGQIDLNAVRLCFQVFLEGASQGKFTQQLPPAISDPIYDKKAICDLVIYKLSHCSASALGGQEVILLCDRVVKDDIELRFFEESPEGHLLWEGLGEFLPNDVHKQVAISFRTPRYKTLELHQSVNCWLQLRRPSDGAVSERRPFEIYPPEAGSPSWLRTVARQKVRHDVFQEILSLETRSFCSSTPASLSDSVKGAAAKVLRVSSSIKSPPETIKIPDDASSISIITSLAEHSNTDDPRDVKPVPVLNIGSSKKYRKAKGPQLDNMSDYSLVSFPGGHIIEGEMAKAVSMDSLNDLLSECGPDGIYSEASVISQGSNDTVTREDEEIQIDKMVEDLNTPSICFDESIRDKMWADLKKIAQPQVSPPERPPKMTANPAPPPLPPKRVRKASKRPFGDEEDGLEEEVVDDPPNAVENSEGIHGTVLYLQSRGTIVNADDRHPGETVEPYATTRFVTVEAQADDSMKTEEVDEYKIDFEMTEAANTLLYDGVAPMATVSEFDDTESIYYEGKSQKPLPNTVLNLLG